MGKLIVYCVSALVIGLSLIWVQDHKSEWKSFPWSSSLKEVRFSCAYSSASADLDFVPAVVEKSAPRILDDRLEALISLVTSNELYRPFLKQDNFSSRRKWAFQSGSSAWLANHNYYIMISRLMYIPEEDDLGKPYISVLVAQLFDQNWNELIGDFSHIQLTLSSFPSILPIPIEDVAKRGFWLGPEDPRVILSPALEPLVSFNMEHSVTGGRRRIFLYNLATGHLVPLKVKDIEYERIDKNWVPYIDQDLARDHISFIYCFSPLLLVDCDILSGLCTSQSPREKWIQVSHTLSFLRGGTNLVPIPTNAADHQLWMGFARARIPRAKYPGGFFRPCLFILAKVRKTFAFWMMTTPLELGSNVPKDSRLVADAVIPYSIPYWDSKSDHLILTMARDDALRYVLELRGVASIVSNFKEITVNANSTDSNNKRLVDWAIDTSYQYMLDADV